MMIAVRFDKETGAIKLIARGTSETMGGYITEHDDGLLADLDYVPYPDRYYVDLATSTIKERPVVVAVFDKKTIVADGEDTATITLPVSMSIKLDDKLIGESDHVEIVSDHPASYEIAVEKFPYIPASFFVMAVAS